MSDRTQLEEAKEIVRLAQWYETTIRIRDALGPTAIKARDEEGKVNILGVAVNARDFELMLWDATSSIKESLVAAVEKLKDS